jgi:uncharacterized protein YjiS (DUF1127 family)
MLGRIGWPLRYKRSRILGALECFRNPRTTGSSATKILWETFMRIMEQRQGDRVSPELEPSGGAGADESPRLSLSPGSSRRGTRGVMSWLATVLIESLAASAQAMYPVCPAPNQTREEDAEPALQAFRQAELGSDPAWSHPVQSWSFDDLLAMEKVSPASFGWSGRVRSRIVRLWSAFCRAQQMRRAIAELEALDDRMLKDIGIHRCEIESIVRYGSC